MGDPEQWSIDDNGYYLTNYRYSPAIDTSNWPSDIPMPADTSASLYSIDVSPIDHVTTFKEPSNIKINYSVGKMYAGTSTNPSPGLYINYKTADGGNYLMRSIPIDNLGNADEINSVINNPIILTERETTLENVTELTIKTSGRPVLWVDYIQIEVLE